MKNLNLIIASVLIISACNSKPKQAENKRQQSEIATPVTQAVSKAAPKAITQADYDTLYTAALENQIHIVKKKIDAGLDVNHADEGGRTALMLAAFNGNKEIVKMLLKAGADCRMVDATNRSALMFACTGPFLETVKILIEAGSEINGMDSHENWTPVMFAAGEGQLEVVKYLIAKGADITMVDVDGESSYDFAVSRGHTATAEYLKQLAQGK